ncbi:hypothetical protein Dsin_031957 [Dipteronia sinensis]|uniref:Ionotropic glutamate receptor L-glutamate and glycine-binding domain-containing protein n=1 Tax=Dipteronia sinensis TaxID=43782 RepID=A0AAD9ZM04_9ROSI|nr:hypothetical protein Dsin_031957 [Dipteronia sinensis]
MDFKREKLNNQAFFFRLMILFILLNPSSPSKPDNRVKNVSLSYVVQVHVGVIVDMGSWSGKISHSCISMAISDICALNNKTRVLLHWMNSKGDSILALHAGKGLRRVGFWTSETGNITKESNSPSTSDLEVIIWPGGSATTPKRQLIQMSSKVLRIGVPAQSLFKELVDRVHDSQSDERKLTGFCIEVFSAAMATLPYPVPYQFIPFEYANGSIAGSHNDLLHLVYLKKLDAAVGDITITANRSLYVDFTLPFSDMGVGMIMPTYQNNNMREAIEQLVKVCSDHMGVCSAYIEFKLHGHFNFYVNRSTNPVGFK